MFRVRNFLLILSLSVFGNTVVFGLDGVGEGLDVGIYKRISTGHANLEKKLVSKRVNIAPKRLQESMKKKCGKESSGLLSNLHFSPDELNELQNGIISSFFKRQVEGKTIDSNTADCMLGVINSDYAQIQRESTQEQGTLEDIGSFGIFSDGDTSNSSFDLMADLEKMHEIIFSREVPYKGSENRTTNPTAKNLSEFLSQGAPVQGGTSKNISSLSDRLSYDLANAGWNLSSTQEINPSPTLPSFNELCRRQSSTLSGVDMSLFGPIGGGGNTSSPIDTPTKGASSFFSDRDASRFPCKNYFCVNVDMLDYTDLLVGGGKNYSIQHILEKNLKIVDKYAELSLVQTRFTNNFFKDFNRDTAYGGLANMAYVGTVVNTAPPPVLKNLSPENSPRNKASETDQQKKMNEYFTHIFQDYGLSLERENALNLISEESTQEGVSSNIIERSVGNTNDIPNRFEKKIASSSSYTSLKTREKKNEYSDSLLSDLQEFEGFIHAWTEYVYDFGVIIQNYYDIPNTR